jgi:hypothetical protein
MKQLKLSLIVIGLTLAFSVFTVAGDMPGGVTQPNPAPSPQSVTLGDIHCGIASTSESMSGTSAFNPLTENVLNLVQGVLSLF